MDKCHRNDKSKFKKSFVVFVSFFIIIFSERRTKGIQEQKTR